MSVTEILVKPYHPNYKIEITNIFFENTSKKKFENDKQKDDFFNNWLGVYLINYTSEVVVADLNNKICGYLAGCSNSILAKTNVGKTILSYTVFDHLFDKFPAHFHINVSKDSQGKGIGKKLVAHYLQILAKKEISGLHIVTSPNQPNIKFYESLGFKIIESRPFKNWELLFMGLLL
jgi:ribosomal protein S18 acetylase RimI-like enzyme